jgi:hypothetical protein
LLDQAQIFGTIQELQYSDVSDAPVRTLTGTSSPNVDACASRSLSRSSSASIFCATISSSERGK